MANKTAIPAKLPPPPSLGAIEREYYRRLHLYVQAYMTLMRQGLDQVVPKLKAITKREQPVVHKDSVARMDANVEHRIQTLFDWVEQRMSAEFPDVILRKWAKAMIGHSSKTSKVSGEKLASAVGLDIGPLFHDRQLVAYYQNVVDENVGLIKSITTRSLPTFKNSLVYAITGDLSSDAIAKMIASNFSLTRSAARTIARDQVGKLNAALNQHRQEQLGGSRYRWRTSKDSRVAGNPSGLYPNAEPSHWKREGKIFSWSSPPKGGHPGVRVRCRCYAEMVIEDILE